MRLWVSAKRSRHYSRIAADADLPQFVHADCGVVTQIQHFGSAVSPNIQQRCLMLTSVYRRGSDAEPVSIEVPAPTNQAA
jgi:hypothetical protein